ncbi:MAG: hypothetical protein MSG64_03890 [Pyrinomonadaceae bacterium MAG19_C2-C3]|nr:hypothetical protein [Pyrinomonadaceae bacterium MAG19_C2-C3]
MSVARQHSDEARLRFYARIADCNIKIVADASDVKEEVLRFVSVFSPVESSNSRLETDCTIYIKRYKASSGSWTMPYGASGFEVESGHCYSDGNMCLLKFGDSTVFVERPDAKIVTVIYFPGKDLIAELPFLIRYAIQLALHRRGRFHLHSAAVVNPDDGRGALLIGDSGAGKSTLTVQLARAGWNFLSDDVVVLSTSATGVQTFWCRRFFSLTEKTIQACDVNCDVNSVAQPLGMLASPQLPKRMFMPEDVFGHPPLASCLPNKLFFVSLSHQAGSVVRSLTAGEALLMLIKRCAWATYEVPDVARAFIHTLESLVNQCRCYELSSGYDVLENPDTAVRLIGGSETENANRANV